MKNRCILFIWLFLVFTTSCKKQNRFYIKHFDNQVLVEVNRFDLDFINLNTDNLATDLETLVSKHPSFFPFFLENVLGMNSHVFTENLHDTPPYLIEIKEFLHDTVFIKVHQDVKDKYDQIEELEKQLSVSYSYLQHYFPKKQLPEIYFFVSGFNHEIVATESMIGIGVDLYLGKDYDLYQQITHDYLIPNMKKEMIVSDILRTILYQEFPFKAETNLLNSMLYEGKILYLLSVVSPYSKDELLIGYSPEELAWAKQYEKAIWSAIIEQKHLYSTDYFLINQYINVAPFTSPITADSPGRLGMWIGWQIINQYMKNNKDIDLTNLMNDINYQRILENSHYRP